MPKKSLWLHEGLGIVFLGFLFLGQAVNAAAQQADLLQTIDKLKQELSQGPKAAMKVANDLPNYTPANSQEIKALMELIGITHDDVQQKAIDCMSKISDAKLGAEFIPYLSHKNGMVQATAAGMCGKLKVAESVSGLIELIQQAPPVDGPADTPAKRAAVTAVAALGEIGDDRAIPVLTERLGHMGGYESNALAKFGHRVVPQFFKLVIEGKERKIRQAAAQVLIMLNDPKAIPLFRKEIKNKSSQVRKYAMIGLLNSDPANALHELLALWQNDPQDAELENQIMFYINNNRLKDQSLSPFLIRLLEQSPDRDVRKGAVIALGRIGGGKSAEALKKALNDKDEQVQLYAGQALEMLTSQPAGDTGK